jgi:hypothetical protein
MTPEALQRVQRADPEYTPDLEIVTGSTLAKVRALTPNGERLLESWPGSSGGMLWLPVDRAPAVVAEAESEGLTAVKH